LVNDLTFRQLKESNYYHPEITEVIFDANQMLKCHCTQLALVKKVMIDILRKYFKEGLQLLEDMANERGLKRRLIVETTPDNIDFLNS
jgi:hypothetical protein